MPIDPPKDINAIFRDGSQIDAAVRKATRLAWLAHKREGLPIAVWKDGQTVWIPAAEIEISDDDPSEATRQGSAMDRERQDGDPPPEHNSSDPVQGEIDGTHPQGAGVIRLDPDVAQSFKDSESVNRALRLLLDLAKREVP